MLFMLIKKAVFCGILDKPVDFVVMGDDEATVSAEVIFYARDYEAK